MDVMTAEGTAGPVDEVWRRINLQTEVAQPVIDDLADALATSLSAQQSEAQRVQTAMKAATTRAVNGQESLLSPVRDTIDASLASAVSEQSVTINQVGGGGMYDAQLQGPSSLGPSAPTAQLLSPGNGSAVDAPRVYCPGLGFWFADGTNDYYGCAVYGPDGIPRCAPGEEIRTVLYQGRPVVACYKGTLAGGNQQPMPELPPGGSVPPIVGPVPTLPPAPPVQPGPVTGTCPAPDEQPTGPCDGKRIAAASVIQVAELEGAVGTSAWALSDCARRQIDAAAGTQFPIAPFLPLLAADPSGLSLLSMESDGDMNLYLSILRDAPPGEAIWQLLNLVSSRQQNGSKVRAAP